MCFTRDVAYCIILYTYSRRETRVRNPRHGDLSNEQWWLQKQDDQSSAKSVTGSRAERTVSGWIVGIRVQRGHRNIQLYRRRSNFFLLDFLDK